jgi:hypothetical protein
MQQASISNQAPQIRDFEMGVCWANQVELNPILFPHSCPIAYNSPPNCGPHLEQNHRPGIWVSIVVSACPRQLHFFRFLVLTIARQENVLFADLDLILFALTEFWWRSVVRGVVGSADKANGIGCSCRMGRTLLFCFNLNGLVALFIRKD